MTAFDPEGFGHVISSFGDTDTGGAVKLVDIVVMGGTSRYAEETVAASGRNLICDTVCKKRFSETEVDTDIDIAADVAVVDTEDEEVTGNGVEAATVVAVVVGGDVIVGVRSQTDYVGGA